jgi:predicted membrane protein (TIGR00267 family)
MVRRYFFTNGFDGAISMLGVVIGLSLLGNVASLIVVTAGLGAALGMFVSGFMGTYVTESAESERRMRELREVMLTDVRNTVFDEAGRIGAIVAGLLQGSGSLVFSICVLSPFIASMFVEGLTGYALPLSVILGLAVLFLMGILLGKITKQKAVLTGIKMATAGVITALILILIDLVL